jgi:SAM-dependent methyltransferase
MNTEKTGKETSLRNTFDRDALLYDKARPGYPDALFRDIIAFSNIPETGSILEIGCGTAQATLPFARRGYSIHCIELGASLAAVAERNLAPYPKVQVSVGVSIHLVSCASKIVMTLTVPLVWYRRGGNTSAESGDPARRAGHDSGFAHPVLAGAHQPGCGGRLRPLWRYGTPVSLAEKEPA